MAIARPLTFSLSTIASSLILLGGCQSQRSMVDQLPPPNFNGPVVSAPAAPTPAPVAPAPQVSVAPTPPPKVAPNKSVASAIPKEWIPRVAPRPWKWIVIHHSATPTGGAAVFDKMHRDKGWDELGYDFVIGNGTDSGNGQVEVGSRWPKQKWGAHAKTPNNEYNERGIGICLVGNFD